MSFSNPAANISNNGSAGFLADSSNKTSTVSFAVKYNTSGTNPQGKVQLQVTSNRNSLGSIDGNIHTYEITSNAISSLNVKLAKADYAAKCNVVEIVTNPVTGLSTAVSLDGGATMQLSLDSNLQTLGITVYKNKNIGGMWFSTNWDGKTTIDKTVLNATTNPLGPMHVQ